MSMKIAWVFDFDNTIAKATLDDVPHLLADSMTIEEFFPEMVDFICSLDEAEEDIYILTGRHPNMQHLIKNCVGTLNIKEIFCRNFCLNYDEVQKAYHEKKYHEFFLQDLLHWKTSILNFLATEYTIVMYYDDYSAEFKNYVDLSSHVFVHTPFHLDTGGFTFKKIIEMREQEGKLV